MNIFVETLNSIILLFGFGFIGFYIIAKKILPGHILNVLSPLVLDIALPLMVFSNIISNFDSNKIEQWYVIPIWWLFAFVLMLLPSLIYYKFSKSQFKAEVTTSLIFPNALFFPIVIIPALFGKDTILLVYLFLFTLFFPLILFNSFNYFFKVTNIESYFKFRKLINPVLITTILALILSLTGLNKYIPNVFINIASKVGDMTLPLIMIFIGGSIYLDIQNRGKIRIVLLTKFLLFKHILIPSITLIALLIVKPEPYVSFLIFLQSILPPVTAVSLLAERVNGNTTVTNQFLIFSFLVSIISIPLSLTIYDIFLGLPNI